ncbi:MAG: major capsid protein [Microviridae sp.]|nr:MAG: major capsid protein [Microviridae sp.]
MKKTLGGDRLGSGKKMSVDLHGYERSTHDLSYIWRSTMSSGTLVPFMSEIALPGDTFDIDLECEIRTHPTEGPLFGSYKVQLDVFQAPIRLYNSLLHNNMLGIGMNMNNVKLPIIWLEAPFNADPAKQSENFINPSCLLAYLGIRGVGDGNGFTNILRSFNAVPILAYWEIYKNYYANKQEEIGAVIHTPAQALLNNITQVEEVHNGIGVIIPEEPLTGTVGLSRRSIIRATFTGPVFEPEQLIITTDKGTYNGSEIAIPGTWATAGGIATADYNRDKLGNTIAENWRNALPEDIKQGQPKISQFQLANIDAQRREILANGTFNPHNITATNLWPYRWLDEIVNGINNSASSQEGLALKTYQSDLFNNWLSTDWIDGANGISEITAIDTSGGSFTIDTLNLSKKVYEMLNRIAVSGGSYDDWLDAVYAHDRYTRSESPMYMGGLSKELVFQEVISNAPTEEKALGTLGGRGVLTNKHKGGKIYIKVDEPSYIMGIVSLTPRIDYSQGNKWDVHLQTMDDLHKPALDEIGFQELITEQMAWWDTKWDNVANKWVTQSAGKQPAWINYMTNVNRTHGNFALEDNEMFMTLNRRYEMDTINGNHIKDLTTYIDPAKFNNIFAETALDAQNFWTQIGCNITARRKMSAKIMPNL